MASTLALPNDLASRSAQEWMAKDNVSDMAWSAKHFSSKWMKLGEDMVEPHQHLPPMGGLPYVQVVVAGSGHSVGQTQ